MRTGKDPHKVTSSLGISKIEKIQIIYQQNIPVFLNIFVFGINQSFSLLFITCDLSICISSSKRYTLIESGTIELANFPLAINLKSECKANAYTAN